jgi:hypothetical protein
MNGRTKRTHRAGLAVLVAGLLAGGCVAPCPEDYSKAPGEAASLRRIVFAHNANADRVPKLWARAKVSLVLTDERGRVLPWGSTSPLAPSNALVLLAKGGEPGAETGFVIVGKEASAELFRAGVDPAAGLYYLWYNFGEAGQAWVGRASLAGAPGVRRLPIDPTQIISLLGVSELPVPGGARLPAVVLRLEGGDRPSYAVRYLAPQPVTGELKLWREVLYDWSDERPPRPYRVRLFDPAGYCRMVADLAAYEPIEADGEGPPPVMPTDIRICWPKIPGVQTASSMHMVLSEMSTTKRFSRKAFEFERFRPAGVPVEVVDAHVAPVGAPRRRPKPRENPTP